MLIEEREKANVVFDFVAIYFYESMSSRQHHLLILLGDCDVLDFDSAGSFILGN